MSDCGTYAGYQAHGRRGEYACEPCKKALAEYTAKWRKANPEAARRGQSRQYARERALRELARRHPDELAELLRDELGETA